jgi:hypothetical protein
MTGTEEEVAAHVIKVNTLPNGDLVPDEDAKCWGAMEVGQGAWKDFHEKGIHPMTTFTNNLEQVLLDTGSIVDVLRKEND